MTINAVILSLLTIGAAQAATPSPGQEANMLTGSCTAVQQIQGQVRSCADNSRLLSAGRSCYQFLQEKWEANTAVLTPGKKSDSQNEKMALARRDFQTAEKNLKQLVKFTRKNTKLLSQYSKALRRPPGSGPVPACYSQPKKELKALGKALKKKIKEGRLARKELKRMRKIAKNRGSEMRSLGALGPKAQKKMAKTKGAGAPKALDGAAKRQPTSLSGITGLKGDANAKHDPQDFLQSFFEK